MCSNPFHRISSVVISSGGGGRPLSADIERIGPERWKYMLRSWCEITILLDYISNNADLLSNLLHKTCLHVIKLSTTLMQLGNFIDAFLARHVSSTFAHHQEH